MSSTFEVVIHDHDLLGEGPWWSVREQSLWRVDILGQTVHSWSPDSGRARKWEVGADVGFVVPATEGRVVLGLRQSISLLELDSGTEVQLVETPGAGSSRFNDGKTDRRGRIWAGTIVDDQDIRDGTFGHVSNNGFNVHVDGMGISNGLGWSPDSTTMYLTDSAVRTIWAFDFDVEGASLSNRRVFAVDTDCEPDGLTVDAEGGVWSAKWNGGRVVRYSPDGAISEVIQTPVSRPTSCAFGGSDLDILYVTSASVGLDDEERSSTPAGAVLAIMPGVRGLAEAEAYVPRNINHR